MKTNSVRAEPQDIVDRWRTLTSIVGRTLNVREAKRIEAAIRALESVDRGIEFLSRMEPRKLEKSGPGNKLTGTQTPVASLR